MNKTEKEQRKSPEDKIQWHPGFCAATELMLREHKKDLTFQEEYNLNKKPLQVDLLIVEKVKDVQIKPEVGHIFREHNLMEYKSPDDDMSIDDYSKVLSYAYLYKSLGQTENARPFDTISVSLVRERKPQKMMKQLESMGRIIKKYAKGVYYVEGELVPVQIVVTKRLDKLQEEYAGFRVLSKNATEEDVQNFVHLASGLSEPGDRNLADAVLQVSVPANQKLYDEMRRRSAVCEALRELMKDEIEAEVAKAKVQAEKDGIENGIQIGEQRLKQLCCRLEQDDRREDIFRAMKDPEFLKKLYEEYEIV